MTEVHLLLPTKFADYARNLGKTTEELVSIACLSYMDSFSVPESIQLREPKACDFTAVQAIVDRLVYFLDQNIKGGLDYAFTTVYRPETINFFVVRDKLQEAISTHTELASWLDTHELAVTLSGIRLLNDPTTGRQYPDPSRKLSVKLVERSACNGTVSKTVSSPA